MNFIIAILTIISAQAKDLTIDNFLTQVQANHAGFKASQTAQEGADLRSKGAALLTLPQLELTAQTGVDERPPSNIALGDYKSSQAAQIAISEQTSFGTKAKLKYDWMFQNTEHASGSFLPVPEYYTASPSIEISQSLWRNGFGSETRAQKNAIQAEAKSKHFEENFKAKTYMMEAKNVFLNLYFTRQTMAAIQESLNLSGKLKQWAQGRASTNLGDRSDFLQTKTVYESRQLDLSRAQLEEKTLSRYFNSLRGVDSDTVTEQLARPQVYFYKKENLDESKYRDDVKSAIEGLKAAKSESLINKESNKPTLDIYGSYSLNGLDIESQKAISSSFESNHPAYAVGIRFSMPLALEKSSDVRMGYEKEALAADLYLQRKYLEQERDFKSLQSKIDNTLERMRLAKTLEASQKEKLEAEKKRHAKGRTTLFQVLQFEQEYVDSQLNMIKTESDYHTLMNELQLYKGGSL